MKKFGDNRKSFLIHLECSRCGQEHDARAIQNLCKKCGSGPLLCRYDLGGVSQALKKDELFARRSDMWRYRELLPLDSAKNIVSMGEGWTPLVKLERIGRELGLNKVFLKDEGLNPTGTFKARGASVCVSKLKELGVTAIGIPTAGNAGGAFACYGARAGIEVHVAMPSDAPDSTKKQCSVAGGNVYLVEGRLDRSADFISKGIARYGWFNASTFKEPWRVEGKKTMGFELFEQFNGDVPDVVLYPTGGGVGMVAIWKAFEELREMGWLSTRSTRMYSVQSEGCNRLKRALDEGQGDTELRTDITTTIPGLAAPHSLGDALCLSAIKGSGGGAIVVSDADILTDMARLAAVEGEFVCPEGASTLTALRQLKEKGLVDRNDRVVLLNTGNGLKYLEFVQARTVRVESGVDAFGLAKNLEPAY